MMIWRLCAWELWLRNRLGLTCCFAGIPLGALLARVLDTPLNEPFSQLVYLPLVAVSIYLIEGTLYAEHNPKTKRLGFPPHAFLLPLTTDELVKGPMACSLTIVPLGYLLWAECVYQPMGMDLPLLVPMIFLGVIGAWFQAVCWAFSRHPILGILTYSLVLAVLGGLTLLASSIATEFHGVPIKEVRLIVLTGSLLLAYKLALAGVARNRTGEDLLSMPKWKLRWRSLSSVFPDRKRAQGWYEWRVHGTYLILLTGLIQLIMLIPPLLLTMGEAESLRMMALMWWILPLISFSMGLEFSKPFFGSKEYEFSSFYATLPFSDEELARAKLKMAAKSITLTWLVTIVMSLIFAQVSTAGSALQTLMKAWHQEYGLMSLVGSVLLLLLVLPLLSWNLLSTSLTLGLVGSKRLTITLFAVGMVLLMISLVGGAWLSNRPDYLDQVLASLPRLAMIGFILSLLLGTGLLLCTQKRGYLADLTLLPLLVSSLAVLGLLYWITGLLPLLTEGRWALCSTLAALAVWAGFPFAAAPMAMAHNRHRS